MSAASPTEEVVEAVARVICDTMWPNDYECVFWNKETMDAARAVLSSPPVSELVEALRLAETALSFIDGLERKKPDFAADDRTVFEVPLTQARATLAHFIAKMEKSDV